MDCTAHYGLLHLLLAVGVLGVSIAVFTNKFVTPHSFSFIFSCAVAVVAVCLQLSPNLFALKGMFSLDKLGTREVIVIVSNKTAKQV